MFQQKNVIETYKFTVIKESATTHVNWVNKNIIIIKNNDESNWPTKKSS